MHVFEANITREVSDYLFENLKNITSFEVANQKMYDAFGILQFFENNDELEILKEIISVSNTLVQEPDRAEYGDFQTNEDLANKVILQLVSKNISPEIVIEPTCGKGNFIIASLKNFDKIKHIFGVEIYKPYVWETKFNIVHFFLNNPKINKPIIEITHCDVFDYDFKKIEKQFSEKVLPTGEDLGGANILIIGNPPWVTNSKLGSLNSLNLPKKSNFKNHSGLDAITGKGNFDIAEFITLSMLNTFQKMEGNLLLLVKNSVIKNIVSTKKRIITPLLKLKNIALIVKKNLMFRLKHLCFIVNSIRILILFVRNITFTLIKIQRYNLVGWRINLFRILIPIFIQKVLTGNVLLFGDKV